MCEALIHDQMKATHEIFEGELYAMYIYIYNLEIVGNFSCSSQAQKLTQEPWVPIPRLAPRLGDQSHPAAARAFNAHKTRALGSHSASEFNRDIQTARKLDEITRNNHNK